MPVVALLLQTLFNAQVSSPSPPLPPPLLLPSADPLSPFQNQCFEVTAHAYAGAALTDLIHYTSQPSGPVIPLHHFKSALYSKAACRHHYRQYIAMQ